MYICVCVCVRACVCVCVWVCKLLKFSPFNQEAHNLKSENIHYILHLYFAVQFTWYIISKVSFFQNKFS